MSHDYRKFLFKPNTTKTVSTLSSKECHEDLQLLVTALEKAYPAQWAMPKDSWDEILQQIKDLKFGDGTTVANFGDTVAEILWPIPDGHLKVKHQGKVLGSSINKLLRTSTTGANTAGQDAWKLTHRESELGTIPVLAISRFPQPSEAEWDGFLDAVKSCLNAPVLIVDLRENNGGNSTMSEKMTSILLGYDLSFEWIREIVCESPESYALQTNTYASIIWTNYESKGLTPPAELSADRDSQQAKAEELSKSRPQVHKAIYEYPGKKQEDLESKNFKGKIFVLVDPETKSSGEWCALHLKRLPQTQIVGENTYGMIHFGNTGHLVLPNSGLSVALCMKINDLTEGNFYEKTGIPPNIKVSNTDSLEYVLKNLLTK